MIQKSFTLFLFLLPGLCFIQCDSEKKSPENKPPSSTLFELLPPERTSVSFSNNIVEGLNTNVLMYEYFYNGAGVAAGDLNNDGLEDLFFTSNLENSALYLNHGDFHFEEVAAVAGVTGRPGPWKTGISMADVNGDGLLDLYICYSGKMAPEKLVNQLFINQGNDEKGIPRFQEMTKECGLDFPTNTTHAVFFDFDNDGDLDLLILNHHPDSLPKLNEKDTEQMLKVDDQQHGVRLLRNENGVFKDITIKAGIISSPITYGLGAGVADLNLDGWTDFYICNDFSLPDYLYINNGDGTFTDKLGEMIGHTSYASMGNNVSDINNDGLPDIFSLDMLPEDNRRQKLLLAPNDYDYFELSLRLGFHHQYLRSMLQVNNGNGTFSEVGQIAGIDATDWSWSPLFADFDNDGWKDLLITNGYLKDYTDMDFLRNMEMFVQQNPQMKRTDVLDLVNRMPRTELHNYIFQNNKNITFSRSNDAWGLTHGSYSNGAAYVDLDNDGDLEIVTNNINKPAFLYKNNSEHSSKHYLKVKLAGAGKNTFGIGAKVYVYNGGSMQLQEQQPARGYQSVMSQIMHFGLDSISNVDSVKVIWPGGGSEVKTNISSDQTLQFKQDEAKEKYKKPMEPRPFFTEVASSLSFAHKQPEINDFKRQPLLTNARSFEGPCMASADVNGDGEDDIFIGGAAGQVGKLFLSQDNKFIPQPDFYSVDDAAADDVDALFFDANNDGALDLYVCSGGYHDFPANSPALQDRFYLNDGKGKFQKSMEALPQMLTSTRAVAAADINGDGFSDLFVGGYVVPGRYPETPISYILINDGQGNFSIRTNEFTPELEKIGMVTDASWTDLNGDGKNELILVGEWMPISVFSLRNGKLINSTSEFFNREYNGLWNSLLVTDMNGDNKPDIIAGNLGKNSQLQASETEPAELYFKDFDNNGSIDPVLCFYIQGVSYPYLTRRELITQVSKMEQRFPTFASFADAKIGEVFTASELTGAGHLVANHTATSYFEQNTEGKFSEKPLPPEVQYAPVYTITALDYNKDGKKDILLCGNMNQARIRFGKYDANYGLLLQGDGNGSFTTIPQYLSGFGIRGDVRSVIAVNDQLLFGINGNKVLAYKAVY